MAENHLAGGTDMTANIELLPMPETLRQSDHDSVAEDYARTNVEYHTAKMQARIELLEQELKQSEQRATSFKAEAVGFRTAFATDREYQYQGRMGFVEAKLLAQDDVETIMNSVKRELARVQSRK